MKNTMKYKGYIGSVEFSEEDGVFLVKFRAFALSSRMRGLMRKS